MRRHAGNLPQLDPIEDMGIMVRGGWEGGGTFPCPGYRSERLDDGFVAASSLTFSHPGAVQDEELMEAARKIQDLEAELKKNPGRGGWRR